MKAYKYKIETNPKISIREVCGILSKELEIRETTISNTIKEYRETKPVRLPNKQRQPKNIITKMGEFKQHATRRKIHQFWINRELPTLNKLLSVVNDDESSPFFFRATIHRLLKSMNFWYVRKGQNSILLDSNELIL